ncbi:MAG TPA: redoxin domain-containing protein [Ottowia sp.]|nr:redoxin domain-containing protein [Ottowia sp.]
MSRPHHFAFSPLLLALLWAVQAWQTRDVPSGAAPDFSAAAVLPPDRDAAMLSLAQWRAAHRGRPVALHFWAEWCGICRLEQHSVTRLAADWPVLTVATQSGAAPAVHAVQARRELPWATVADPDGTLLTRYGLKAVPAFVVVAPDGRLSSVSVGYTSEAGMRLRLWWAGLWAGG